MLQQCNKNNIVYGLMDASSFPKTGSEHSSRPQRYIPRCVPKYNFYTTSVFDILKRRKKKISKQKHFRGYVWVLYLRNVKKKKIIILGTGNSRKRSNTLYDTQIQAIKQLLRLSKDLHSIDLLLSSL